MRGVDRTEINERKKENTYYQKPNFVCQYQDPSMQANGHHSCLKRTLPITGKAPISYKLPWIKDITRNTSPHEKQLKQQGTMLKSQSMASDINIASNPEDHWNKTGTNNEHAKDKDKV